MNPELIFVNTSSSGRFRSGRILQPMIEETWFNAHVA
jgi:hypothetical protein